MLLIHRRGRCSRLVVDRVQCHPRQPTRYPRLRRRLYRDLRRRVLWGS